MRGEYWLPARDNLGQMELPPRARRIPRWYLNAHDFHGTTSACAENTEVHRYPVCYRTELPPRARRIPLGWVDKPQQSRTISACAENTDNALTQVTNNVNYLRVRGEYIVIKPKILDWKELPPRARRIPVTNPQAGPRGGTTSACAENTWRQIKVRPLDRNYLRVRGEYSPTAFND